MTLDAAFALLGPTVGLVEQLITQILLSQHMSDEQKKQAIQQMSDALDQTAAKVANVRFSSP